MIRVCGSALRPRTRPSRVEHARRGAGTAGRRPARRRSPSTPQPLRLDAESRPPRGSAGRWSTACSPWGWSGRPRHSGLSTSAPPWPTSGFSRVSSPTRSSPATPSTSGNRRRRGPASRGSSQHGDGGVSAASRHRRPRRRSRGGDDADAARNEPGADHPDREAVRPHSAAERLERAMPELGRVRGVLVPGDPSDMIAKIRSHPDVAIVDLEDAVAPVKRPPGAPPPRRSTPWTRTARAPCWST